MPRFIDVGNNRVRPAEELDMGSLPLDLATALGDLHVGNHHVAYPLGRPNEQAAAYQLVDRTRSSLQTTEGFLVYMADREKQLRTQDSVTIDRALYGPDGSDDGAALRYALHMQSLAPDELRIGPDQLAALIGRGGLIAGVATLEDVYVPDSDFDALFIPRDWLELQPPEGMNAEDYAIALAAGHVLVAMDGLFSNPN